MTIMTLLLARPLEFSSLTIRIHGTILRYGGLGVTSRIQVKPKLTTWRPDELATRRMAPPKDQSITEAYRCKIDNKSRLTRAD